MAANALHRVYRGEYCTQQMGRLIEFNLNIHLLLVVRMEFETVIAETLIEYIFLEFYKFTSYFEYQVFL